MVNNAVVAAMYVVLTLVTFPISFLGIQFRIAEFLVLLCFFRRDYAIGVTLGCVIANCFSSIGFIDCLFGGIATLISCIFIGFSRLFLVSIVFPVVINAFVVGYELYQFLQADFWVSVMYVAIGELAVMLVSYGIYMAIGKKEWFKKLIDANRNLDWKF